MIKSYGTDAVRWFILSDSPPDKDIQWSETGVNASYKFVQKIHSLTIKIDSYKNDKETNPEITKELKIKISKHILKITESIDNFQLNVAIANFYEFYNTIYEYSVRSVEEKFLKETLIHFLNCLTPFMPHIANECLEIMNKNTIQNNWPTVDHLVLQEEKINLAIQINGKTRQIITVEKDLNTKELKDQCLQDSKVKKYLDKKIIKDIIHIKNKVINYII